MVQTRAVPVIGGLVLAAGLVITLAGCGSNAGGDTDGEGTITVVASTNVWGSVAERVGGDAVSVESLIADAAGDPHAQPDKPSDAAALAGADLVVYNGGGYDEFFTKLVDSTGVDVPRVDAFELSGYDGEANEHVWYDLPTVRKVADALAEEFTTLAPDEKATFTANADALNADLDALLDKAAGVGRANPGAKVLATEPVAAYLLDAAGLTDATPPEFSEAIEEETDPPLSVVAETTELLSSRQVAALVNNAQTETAVTNSLKEAADLAGIPTVDVTETLPEGVTDYVEWMTSAVDALAGALTRS
jgi:zinc/manganese transport system substrate-binding protein